MRTQTQAQAFKCSSAPSSLRNMVVTDDFFLGNSYCANLPSASLHLLVSAATTAGVL